MILNQDMLVKSHLLGVLIDPDHESNDHFETLLGYLALNLADVVLVGGSTMEQNNIDRVVSKIKKVVQCPVVLFPGSELQLSSAADGLLLPSLISGRNAEYLVGKHVKAARQIVSCTIPVFPMGYILIDGGKECTTSQITETTPISSENVGLIIDTAIAGQLLGMHYIYLEAGSGALYSIPENIIASVRQAIDLPLIIGGGIRNADQMLSAFESGANMVVVGTLLEENPDKLFELKEAFSDFLVQ